MLGESAGQWHEIQHPTSSSLPRHVLELRPQGFVYPPAPAQITKARSQCPLCQGYRFQSYSNCKVQKFYNPTTNVNHEFDA